MIRVEKTKLGGVLLVTPDMFEDHRGIYIETYNRELYRQNGIDLEFLQDDVSISTKNVLRGVHGDQETWKLVSCLQGRFYLVVANCDQTSLNFGRWQSFVLSDSNRKQVLIPPRYGNGHLVLSEKAIFHYKQTTYYNPKGQFTYKWDDPKLDIWWPVKEPVLSRRDQAGHLID